MGSNATIRKNRYNAKKYDQLKVVVPKGRKDIISAYAAEKGISLNAYVTGLIDFDMGDWKPSEPSTSEAE